MHIACLKYAGDSTGLPRPPAFLDPSLTEDEIMENGVNYASGGGGILNETGGYFVSTINMQSIRQITCLIYFYFQD